MSETTETVAPKATEETTEQKGILRDLQAERSKRQELQTQLEKIQKANEKAEQTRLEQDGKLTELNESLKAKIAEYEPEIERYRADYSAKKAALLEQLGDDADDFKGLDVPALEKVVAKITKLSSNPPSEPGKPGMTPAGEFGGFKSKSDLAHAVARGVPGAREAYNRIRGGA